MGGDSGIERNPDLSSIAVIVVKEEEGGRERKEGEAESDSAHK